MFPLWTTPLRFLPQPLTAVGLGVTLNLFFTTHPELRERMGELTGKIFRFEVEDLDQTFHMVVDAGGGVRIHTYSDLEPNVTMAGKSEAFLALLFNTADPDSLFFSRELKLSGETDTGLRFKNILDNVEFDWERELAVLVGETAAHALAESGRRSLRWATAGREWLEGEADDALERVHTPRKGDLDDLRDETEALARRLEKTEGAIHRLGKKAAVAKALKK
ncbi:MAG: SCP2 sterol-binding domain-containing protein [Magnetococcales bacterium]|nr:SCP2 sterol-binding domain-containing protein [Magnetococcales bacterium]